MTLLLPNYNLCNDLVTINLGNDLSTYLGHDLSANNCNDLAATNDNVGDEIRMNKVSAADTNLLTNMWLQCQDREESPDVCKHPVMYACPLVD